LHGMLNTAGHPTNPPWPGRQNTLTPHTNPPTVPRLSRLEWLKWHSNWTNTLTHYPTHYPVVFSLNPRLTRFGLILFFRLLASQDPYPREASGTLTQTLPASDYDLPLAHCSNRLFAGQGTLPSTHDTPTQTIHSVWALRSGSASWCPRKKRRSVRGKWSGD
jgi:hypothetical protein